MSNATLHQFVRRGRRFVGKVMTKGRRVSDMLAKPSEVDLLLGKLRQNAGQDGNLQGKVVIVTGSTRGIGRVIAEGFAARGARVVVNGRTQAAVDAVVHALRERGGDVLGVVADVAGEPGVAQLLANTVAHFGTVDVLINNAGVNGTTGKRAWEVGVAEFEKVLQTNLMGPIMCSAHVVDWMVRNGVAGRIINVSSGAGESALPRMGPYGVSKFGLEGLTKYLAADLDQSGITVVAVQPGSVRTDMTTDAFGWDQAQGLPDAEAVLPTFVFAATCPPYLVHGRSISVTRQIVDEFAEGRLASPVAALQPFVFQPLKKDGQVVPRTAPGIAVFDRAESQFGVAPEVTEVVAGFAATQPVHMYPDPSYTRLRTLLAREHGLPEACFVFGNGSSEIIARLITLLVKPGERVISNDPGWFGFNALVARVAAEQVRVPFILKGPANRSHHNLDGILRAIDGRTRLIYLISPSNPEGVPLRDAEFREFLAKVPLNIPVLVDEAYSEYASDPEMLNTAPLVMETDRTVIGLRTFSKFYGLAGMRVGYAYAKPEIANLIARLELPFNIAGIAEAAAAAALSATAFRADVARNIREQRALIETAFEDMRLDYVPGQSGMVLVERPVGDLMRIYAAFEKEGIYLSQGHFFDDKYMLFPVGTAAQNQRNLAVLKTLI